MFQVEYGQGGFDSGTSAPPRTMAGGPSASPPFQPRWLRKLSLSRRLKLSPSEPSEQPCAGRSGSAEDVGESASTMCGRAQRMHRKAAAGAEQPVLNMIPRVGAEERSAVEAPYRRKNQGPAKICRKSAKNL